MKRSAPSTAPTSTAPKPAKNAGSSANAIDQSFGELEQFAAHTWSNLAMVERVRKLRDKFRVYARLHEKRVKSRQVVKPIKVDENTRWG